MSGSPARAVDVLGGFLRALGAEPATLAETVSERAGQFRSRVAGRRILIVLDDAHSERQVRPLLPGAPTCAVLVTARGRLAGLAGASRTELDVLDHAAALELLSRIVGDDRPAREPGAARLIVDRCARLPLAIRLAGTRLATRGDWSPAVLADRLADEHRRLDELVAGDQDVRSSIGPSYRALGARDRCALRRLAVLGLPHFPAWILGALLGVAAAESERAVERLVDAQLVSVAGVDALGQVRYGMLDLVRIFGRERAAAEEPLAVRFRDPPRVLSPIPVDLVPAAVNHLDS